MSVSINTNAGSIKIELYCKECPQTCENFLALCASGYYDGTVFHRNIKEFMIQGGDGECGDGTGGKSIWGKTFPDEFVGALKHSQRGVVSMANSGPDTNQSQFFITYAKAPHLNGFHTVFGQVIDGWDVLDILEKLPVDPAYKPLQDIGIQNVTIHANPLAT